MLKDIEALNKVNKQMDANSKEGDKIWKKQDKLEKSIQKQLRKLYPSVFKKTRMFLSHKVGKYTVSISLAHWKYPHIKVTKRK